MCSAALNMVQQVTTMEWNFLESDMTTTIPFHAHSKALQANESLFWPCLSSIDVLIGNSLAY